MRGAAAMRDDRRLRCAATGDAVETRRREGAAIAVGKLCKLATSETLHLYLFASLPLYFFHKICCKHKGVLLGLKNGFIALSVACRQPFLIPYTKPLSLILSPKPFSYALLLVSSPNPFSYFPSPNPFSYFPSPTPLCCLFC